ncbi:MAG: thymidine kinase [Clostridium chrysemydis]|uniref:thymidine kinase n=1 Tax=Clostridium chrysemydis TaxID=2665504 RepID=UPI003F3065FF
MGKINFYYGVVNSRKSSELLLSYHKNKMAGKSILLLQSHVNSRDGGYIVSRALKEKEKAEIVYERTDIRDLYTGQKLIMIDEIQFFSKKHIDQLVKIAVMNDVLIFCYGLMSDFRANLFPTVAYMLPYCTKIKEIETVCEICGERKATMNKMIGKVDDKNGISVGNHFRGTCLKCYNKKESV